MTVMLIRRHLSRTTIASAATATTTNPIVVVPEPETESSSLPFDITACSTIQRDQEVPSLQQVSEDQLQFLYEQEYYNSQQEHEQPQYRCINYYRGNLQQKRGEPSPQYRQKLLRQHSTTPFKNRKSYNSPTRAMRYYRVWIYTCNAVLFVCVVGFIIVASKIIIANPRRTLIPDFTLTHPSLLYAYFALIMQSGLLQLVGCLGARNLNEQLLNIYWYLLLAFLIGDVLLGAFWIHHFEYIVSQTRPALKQRFRTQYNNDLEFTQLWDMVQRDDHCCGVENYKDFYQNNTMVKWATSMSTIDNNISLIPTAILPASCCGISFGSQSTLPTTPMTTTTTTALKSPEARRNHVFFTTISSTVAAASISTTILPPLPPIFATTETISVTDSIQTNGIAIRCSSKNEVFYMTGCEKRLLTWLRSSLDILFVLGYCVISFLKLCFVGILRYEIREMIQKIRILHNEQRNNIAEYPPDSLLPQTTNKARQQVQVRRYERNGNVVGVTQSLIKSKSTERGSLYGGGHLDGCDENSVNDEEIDVDISATSPLLAVPTSTAAVVSFSGGTAAGGSGSGTVVNVVDKKRSISHEDLCYQGPTISANATRLSSSLANRRYFHAYSADVANELDTNSHCALIISDDAAAPVDDSKDDGNVNDFRHYSKMGRRRREKFANDVANKYEIHELQELTKAKTLATATSVTAAATSSPAMNSVSSCSGGSTSSGGRNRNKI